MSIIVKLNDYYFEYSTIADAPTTLGMTLADFKEYYKQMYGLDGMRNLKERLLFVEKYGTSRRFMSSTDEVLAGNRTGPEEATLSIEEIFKAYCLQEPIRAGWTAKEANSEEEYE